jgi:hypothetical protein
MTNLLNLIYTLSHIQILWSSIQDRLSLIAKIITALLAVSWSSCPMKLGMTVRLYPMSWHICREIRSHLRVRPWRISSIKIRSRNSALVVPMIHPARRTLGRPTPLNVKGTVSIVLAVEYSQLQTTRYQDSSFGQLRVSSVSPRWLWTVSVLANQRQTRPCCKHLSSPEVMGCD